ncbi:MAG: PLP-dependent aminotransferase family protein [Ruminococcaceae bacterium]|nr:PLP-dependent aminotransferase family protein [Oscillospiraceae bacterium]
MKYRIDENSGKPAYLQLYRALREDITAGLFPYGSRLPSKRLLAEEMGLSLVTVEHAYALLCEEGYARSRERSGFFVSFREEDGFSQPEDSLQRGPVPFSKEDEPFRYPFSSLAKTMRRVLAEYGELLLEKSPGKGDEGFRRELCRYLARSRGVNATPEQIVVGSGAEYLYGLIVQLLGTSRCYALEDPCYEQIRKVYGAFGAACELLPLGDSGIKSAALQKSRGDVLHITPYRSFPSGVTATASKKREYLKWAQNGSRILVEDDVESEFTLSHQPEKPLYAMSDGENVIYVNSFSKTVSPSIRVGYMVLPLSLVDQFDRELGFYSCTVPLYEQLVLKELIAGGDFERHINRVRRRLRQQKEKV